MTAVRNIGELVERRLPPDLLAFAKTAAEVAKSAGTRAVLVGGAVRDLLLDRPVFDADFMMEPPVGPAAQELARRSGATLTSHARFQTFSFTMPAGRKIDIVTAREETYPAPAVLPVVSASTIDKDLRRRDFTINAVVCRLEGDFGDVFDPLGGEADLRRRVVRALHEKSFIDDPTRIFRAARFSGRLGFQVEPKTREWIADSIGKKIPAKLSAVRRRHEFELLLKEPRPAAAFAMLREWDALTFLHPEWARADISLMGLEAVPMSEPAAFDRRLIRWFKWWGLASAKRILTDLCFERAVKRRVIEGLGGT